MQGLLALTFQVTLVYKVKLSIILHMIYIGKDLNMLYRQLILPGTSTFVF